MSMTYEEETRQFVGPDDDELFDDREPYCYRCNNSGWIVDCCDDLCQSGEPGESCIHGDGDKLCPDCNGRNAF